VGGREGGRVRGERVKRRVEEKERSFFEQRRRIKARMFRLTTSR